jgi:hypothetical protein
MEPETMSTKVIWRGWLLAVALLVSIPGAPAWAQTAAPRTLDEDYVRLAEDVPGFGGLYFDGAGTTHIYLMDLSLAGEVQDLGKHVEVQQGDYDFRDLAAWKDVVRPQLVQRGAVSLDIDEQRNRLVFGVERGSLETFTIALEKFLRTTRVPPAAVLIEAAEPIVPVELLTDRIRPVPAGVQIQNGNGGICSLGIDATRLGVKGFVTVSHCTATRSLVDGTAFFQSTAGLFNRVGTETVDPPFFLGGSCPSGRACRLSDAAFAAYSSAALSAGGKIANPACSFGQGTLAVNPQTPRLPVTGFLSFSSPVSGSIVNKTGRTTGCTFGFAIGTCVDVNVAGTLLTMVCQNQVSGLALPGDSGAPVFLHGGDHATLAGILWGSGAGSYVYSPWLLAASELGGGIVPNAP